MNNYIQLQNVSKSELYQEIEDILDRKLSILTTKNENEKLSIKEVSVELDVAELTVHNWIKKGKLKGLKLGRRIFIKRTDLNEALEEVKSLKYKR